MDGDTDNEQTPTTSLERNEGLRLHPPYEVARQPAGYNNGSMTASVESEGYKRAEREIGQPLPVGQGYS